MSALRRSREGSCLQPDSRCSATPINGRVTDKCVRRPFPCRTRAREKLALCRRFDSGGGIRTRDAAGLRPLRWHDLRHTFGSLLVAGGVDLVSIKDAMGHSQLTTTSRYLHARPATERAAAFTAAFGGSANAASYSRGRDSLEQPDDP
jgi:hypothetical protein